MKDIDEQIKRFNKLNTTQRDEHIDARATLVCENVDILVDAMLQLDDGDARDLLRGYVRSSIYSAFFAGMKREKLENELVVKEARRIARDDTE